MALSVDEFQPSTEENVLGDLRLQKGDPYGAVLWPAASALARYLLTTVASETALSNLRIVELGTGTGLVSLAAAIGGAHVLATDYEQIPLTILKHAIKVNCLKRLSPVAGLGVDKMSEKLTNIQTGMFCENNCNWCIQHDFYASQLCIFRRNF